VAGHFTEAVVAAVGDDRTDRGAEQLTIDQVAAKRGQIYFSTALSVKNKSAPFLLVGCLWNQGWFRPLKFFENNL